MEGWCDRIGACLSDTMETSIRMPEMVNPEQARRTVYNMLSPVGIPQNAWVPDEWIPRTDYPSWVVEVATPCLVVGELAKQRLPIFSPERCLPDVTNSLINTGRGVWCLLKEELGSAKGVPEDWIKNGGLTAWTINGLMDLYIWVAVDLSLYPMLTAGNDQSWSVPAEQPDDSGSSEACPGCNEVWEWTPLDLGMGSKWYNKRVASLAVAMADLVDRVEHFARGLRSLEIRH